MENDFLDVLYHLNKNPKLANMPLDGSSEFPMERALRLQCDPMIIQILTENGARRSEDLAYGRMNDIPLFCGFNAW